MFIVSITMPLTVSEIIQQTIPIRGSVFSFITFAIFSLPKYFGIVPGFIYNKWYILNNYILPISYFTVGEMLIIFEALFMFARYLKNRIDYNMPIYKNISAIIIISICISISIFHIFNFIRMPII